MANFYTPDSFASATVVLASAVADSGTFTVSYPSGYTQADFTTGLAASGSYMIVNGNDKWTVAASKMSVSYGSSDITVTNSTGGSLAAGSEVALYFSLQDGNDVVEITLPLPAFSAIANGDVITDFKPGVDGYLESAQLVVTTAVTTAAKTATLNWEIGTTNTTGGTLTLTSAAATPLGKVLEFSDFTAANRIYKASKISLEAASVTTFVEGAGYIVLRIRKI
jgi:hypothetical protein